MPYDPNAFTSHKPGFSPSDIASRLKTLIQDAKDMDISLTPTDIARCVCNDYENPHPQDLARTLSAAFVKSDENESVSAISRMRRITSNTTTRDSKPPFEPYYEYVFRAALGKYALPNGVKICYILRRMLSGEKTTNA